MSAADTGSSVKSRLFERFRRLLTISVMAYWLFWIAILSSRLSIWIELASHFVWQGLIGGAILCVLWAMLRNWKMSGLTLVPWCYLLILFQPWYLWSSPTMKEGQAQDQSPQLLKVMSWNVLCVNEDIAEMQRIITAHPVDVLVLVEVRPNLFEQVPALDQMYKHRLAYPSWGGNGIAVLTNRDDVELSRVDLGGKIMPSIVARVGDNRLALVGMHTWSPFPPQRTPARDHQLSELIRWIDQQRQPVCVVGDLNITPWAPAFQKLAQAGLVDSRLSGFGNSASWPAWLGPFGIPIDHALSHGNCRIINRQLGPLVFGSDHRPVIVDIEY